MKTLDITLISISLIVAYGIGFYYYEPELSAETRAFLAKARPPSSEKHVAHRKRLEQELESLSDEYGYSLYEACKTNYHTGKCYIAVNSLGPLGVNHERRQKINELMDSLPVIAGDFSQLGSYQNLISGFYDASYEEMRNGFNDTEDLLLNLAATRRFFDESGPLIDLMMATALYGIVVGRANLMIALNDGVAIPNEYLDLPRLTGERVERSLAEDLNVHMGDIRSGFASYAKNEKMNWKIDDARFQSQQYVEFLDLPEHDYWSNTFRMKRHFFAKNYDRFVHGLDEEFLHYDYIEYFDTVKFTRQTGKILMALSNIYDGAEIDQHGVDAPEAWEWYWKDEEKELCLRLDDTVKRSERVEEATTCLPHIKLQLAELEAAEAKPLAHSK